MKKNEPTGGITTQWSPLQDLRPYKNTRIFDPGTFGTRIFDGPEIRGTFRETRHIIEVEGGPLPAKYAGLRISRRWAANGTRPDYFITKEKRQNEAEHCPQVASA